MKKKPKQGYLGSAFHHWLEFLEYVEHSVHAMMSGKTRLYRRPPNITMNNRLWQFPEDENSEEYARLMKDMTYVHAALAPIVRSSVKYKMHIDTCIELAERYGKNELLHISKNVPMRLPHEWCTIVFEGFGDDDMIVVAQEQTPENHQTYPELELDPDETFICLNIAGYRPGGVQMEDGTVNKSEQLSEFPVEVHMKHNQTEDLTKVIYAGAGGIEPKKEGHRVLDLLYRTFVIWHHQFHLQSILRHKQVAGGRPPASFKPKRLRKRHEHPQFEHTVIQLEVDAPDPSQTGRSIFQPRKRLHQVRGFWRNYRKSGKRVWVKPHWRGDEHLGVVKRDIELVTHQQENNDDVEMAREEDQGSSGAMREARNTSSHTDGREAVSA